VARRPWLVALWTVAAALWLATANALLELTANAFNLAQYRWYLAAAALTITAGAAVAAGIRQYHTHSQPATGAQTGAGDAATPPAAGPLPSAVIWVGVPLRNPYFVGRDELLDQMATELAASSAVAVQALHGLGGVGKTQLAIEYAHRHHSDYAVVAWLDAEQPALIVDQVTALASPLGLPTATDAPATAAAVLAELAHGGRRWLLVFDNAEVPEHIMSMIPASGGHVIVTSRHSQWSALGASLDVDVMTRTEAVTLLTRRVPAINAQIAAAIAHRLGDLPLAVEQAAAYLRQTAMPDAAYLDLLDSRGEELLSRGHVLGREHTLATVWDISHHQLTVTSPPGVILLRLCAFLGPEPIPLDLFTTHTQLLSDPLDQAAGDPLTFTDTIAAITNLSLAKRMLAATLAGHGEGRSRH
jgi:NB-ARC domain-containing protein